MKHSWYFLKNSQGKYDGLWTLTIISFFIIVVVTFIALGGWLSSWAAYYYVVSSMENSSVARAIKPPSIKFADVASWVGSFGGLVLGPSIAGYVARRNKILNPSPVPYPEILPDAGHLDRPNKDDGH